MPKFACLLGVPGSGKVAQAKLLLENGVASELRPLLTVPLLRAEAEAGGEHAAEIAKCLATRQLVPPQMVVDVLTAAVQKEPEGSLFVLVGFPRTMTQVDLLLKSLGAPQFVVALEIGEEGMARRALQKTGTTANTEALRASLAHFNEEIAPIVDFMDSRRLLLRIDANGSTEAVSAGLLQLFKQPPTIHLDKVPTGKHGAPRNSTLEIMQWNVLADGLSGNCKGQGGFTRCPPSWLAWERRRHQLRSVIATRCADVVALQEVDHFEEWYRPVRYHAAVALDCAGGGSHWVRLRRRWRSSVTIAWSGWTSVRHA